MSTTPLPGPDDAPSLPFRFEMVLLEDENSSPPRDIQSAVVEVLGMRSSDDPADPLVHVYAVDADGIEPDRLLLLLHDPEEQQKIRDGRGLVLFLTRARHFGDWMPPSFAASSGLKSHLKENEFAIQTLVHYGVARYVPALNDRSRDGDGDARSELRARLHRLLGRKLDFFRLRGTLETIARDAEALRRIARDELEGRAAAQKDESLPTRIARGLDTPEHFLRSLRALYQLGRRRHAEAEMQVEKALPWRTGLGPVALRRKGADLLDQLAAWWDDPAATLELKQVHTALRAYEVLRDLGEWLAVGAHRWAAQLRTMRVLVVDEALTDLAVLDNVDEGVRETELEVHEDLRAELTEKIRRIVEAFAGRADVVFEYVTGPKVWAEFQKLLDDSPMTGPKGMDDHIYVRRMCFGQPPGEREADRHIAARDLLDYDIILVEVEFRNHYIGPRIIQKLTETVDRLASLPRTGPGGSPQRTGPGGRKHSGARPPSVVVLSQSANFSYVQQCLNLGADAYVRKERMYELPMRAVRARITHRRPEPRGQKSNFRALYSLFPEVIASLQSEDRREVVLGSEYDVLDREWIRALPKADLHTHIGTCIDLDTVEALAFNTAGHLIARREKSGELLKGIEPLLDLVCRTALAAAVLCSRVKKGCWLGDEVEKAFDAVRPDGLPALDPKEWARKSPYERVLHRMCALHPGVNPFEVTALLVAAFTVARHAGIASVVAAEVKKPWEYLDELAGWAGKLGKGEKRAWPLEHLRTITASLRLASDDLYGLRPGELDPPGEVLRERAASVRSKIDVAAHCLAARMQDAAEKLKAGGDRAPGGAEDAAAAERIRVAMAGGLAHLAVPKLAQLVRVPDEPGPDEKSLLKYLRGTALLGADHLQYPENLLLAARSVADQMSIENVTYCELRCETIGYTEASMGAIQATDLLCRALDVAAAWCATCRGRPWTRFNVLLGAKRHKPEEKFRKIVALAEHYLQRHEPGRPVGEPAVPDWWRPCTVAGFDLSGDESAEFHKPAKLIRPLFIHSAPITIHAGEAASAESIWRAVYEYGARRIGHGLRLRENTRLLNYCISEGICMELCPISNQYTNGFPCPEDRYIYDSDWREYYPLRYYLERGLDVCINTDNRQLHARGSLTDDYMCAARLVGGLTRWELLRIVKAGFKHAFLPKREIEVMLRAVESQVYELVTAP